MLALFGVRAGKMGFMLMPVLKPARTSNIFIQDRFRLKRFTQISVDNIRAAEVCSAEATECLFGRDLRSLWQTDFATPRHWIPGQASLPGMTQYIVWQGLFRGNLFTIPHSNICALYLRLSAWITFSLWRK